MLLLKDAKNTLIFIGNVKSGGRLWENSEK